MVVKLKSNLANILWWRWWESMGNIKGIDVSDLNDGSRLISRHDIANILIKKAKDRIVLAYDMAYDIFRIFPETNEAKALSSSELDKLLDTLGIKYNDFGIKEAPENLTVIEIFDGFGITTIVLRTEAR